MTEQLKRAQELIERPSESLNVELKTWIDPAEPEGQVKLIQSIIALRNQNGGFLIIGINNASLKPDKPCLLSNIAKSFHPDKIQGLVTKYASEAFQVDVEFPELDGQQFPVIVVPPGVKTPVAAKADLKIDEKPKVAINDVYVRTLHTNNTVSTAKAPWRDWPRLMEICFDNREADIGRFLRRHLSGLTPQALQNITDEITRIQNPAGSIRTRLEKLLQEGAARFQKIIGKRAITPPPHGAWEVGLLIAGDVPSHSTDHKFLNLLEASNPQYTGWPVWLISRSFEDAAMHPYPFGGAWEQCIFDDKSPSSALFQTIIIDFMSFHPNGQFYQRRAYREDVRTSKSIFKPLQTLDFISPVYDVAEAISVGLHFAKAMGCAPESTRLAFQFQWNNLEGRKLVSWVVERHFWPKGPAHEEKISVYVEVPLDTPVSSIGDYVHMVIQPLYSAFDGYSMPKGMIEELVQTLIQRRR